MSRKFLSPCVFSATLIIAALACGLPSGSKAQETVQAIGTKAAASAEVIYTQIGEQAKTLQYIGTEVNGTEISSAFSTLESELTAASAGTQSAATQASQFGSISGIIHYDYQIVAMRVYWREIHSGKVGYVETVDGQTAYLIPNLQPGAYNIFAWFWPQGAAGAATTTNIVMAKTSAEQNQCKESLLDIVLSAGQAYTGADIGCWGGDFFFLATPAT